MNTNNIDAKMRKSCDRKGECDQELTPDAQKPSSQVPTLHSISKRHFSPSNKLRNTLGSEDGMAVIDGDTLGAEDGAMLGE